MMIRLIRLVGLAVAISLASTCLNCRSLTRKISLAHARIVYRSLLLAFASGSTVKRRQLLYHSVDLVAVASTETELQFVATLPECLSSPFRRRSCRICRCQRSTVWFPCSSQRLTTATVSSPPSDRDGQFTPPGFHIGDRQSVKSDPHQQQCRSNCNFVVCCFDNVAGVDEVYDMPCRWPSRSFPVIRRYRQSWHMTDSL